nr:immunoglobulin light chain junction region [Macaca mulatta]MOW67062.1 immunoglobulin light chain junction region [Macaca mulatta]MOW67292.1 immunoglobulin light chain junction region [Macaca mulatta]MOW67737.1 immunoglobulin light chain junction region [Macaca mulatta]MOW70118.1 immunoglobulin light chain junction region [Macaca mulatta]
DYYCYSADSSGAFF